MLDAVLTDYFGLSAPRVEPLALGADNATAVYRVRDRGRDYFLKARRGPVNPAPLLVPRALADQGVPHLLAPLPTRSGALWVTAEGAGGETLSYTLYPYLEGRMAAHGGLTDAQWVAYGATFRQVHAATLSPEVERAAGLRRETFVPRWVPRVLEIDALVAATPRFAEPVRQALAEFWRAEHERILALLASAELLGARLRAANLPLVPCHADAHLWNILVEPGGALWVVDWDEVLLAPKECDLLFVVGEGIGPGFIEPRETALFFEGYGPADVNGDALAYYRHERAIGDIGGYGEAVFLLPAMGAKSAEAAAERFRSLLAPGHIVDMALGQAPTAK